MRRNLIRLGLVLAGAFLAVLVGCDGGPVTPKGTNFEEGGEPVVVAPPTAGLDGLTGTVAIDGSSTVFPVTEAVAEEFQIATKQGVKVTVGISGTGGGFKKFARGETDISDASRPILKEEMEATKGGNIEYVELPVCFDALTVVVHPACDWIENDTITVAELKKMWEPSAEGQITHWNQINEKWPNEKIALFGAGTDSGTTRKP